MSDAHFASPNNRAIIEATIGHKLEISRFLNQNNPIHRHLDWLNPLEWIGQQPFLLEINDGQIEAVMLTAPEVRDATWLRLFGVGNPYTLRDSWDRMFSKTVMMLQDLHVTQWAALGVSDWIKELLVISKFSQQNTIVVLEWKGNLIGEAFAAPHFDIRPMQPEDLPEIEQIDRLAFSSIWRNSLSGLTKAYNQPGICTVATQFNQVIGYQISTAATIQGHLARLAVHPDHQRQQVASALLLNLLNQMVQLGVWRVTVNTQADNGPSLALYEKFGFLSTPETIPVYHLQL